MTFSLFLHLIGAIIWVGGQLTITGVVLPDVIKRIKGPDAGPLMASIGIRFTIIAAVFLPIQIITGFMLFSYVAGSAWDSDFGKVLMWKLALLVFVLISATIHGVAQATRRTTYAKITALTSLVGSVGIIYFAAMLPMVGS